jgi:uroporphyrinogen-III synthase
VTSANAIRAIDGHAGKGSLTKMPLFAVGGQTARVAADSGFADVVSADGDGGDLAALVAGRLGGSGGALLYLAGNDRARDLPGELARHGLTVDTVVVYRAEPAASLPGPVDTALRSGAVDGVLHYSRRTAESFLQCAARAGADETIRELTHYCLSPRVAEPFAAAGFEKVRIARSPDEAALLDVLGLS